MPTIDTKRRKTTIILVGFLFLESAMVVSLRTLGWFGTGGAIRLVACLFVALLPLLLATFLLARNRLRFGLRSLLGMVALVAVFLYVSAIPLIDYRSARIASRQLVAANARLHYTTDWDSYYTDMGLAPPPDVTSPQTAQLPPWLGPFTGRLSEFLPDDRVRGIWFNSDAQIQIAANHSTRLSSFQSVSITTGVTDVGLRQLQTALPQFEHLTRISVGDVSVPAHWYKSLHNIHTLWVWGEGPYRGKPFPPNDLADIVSLRKLEVLMVLGYAFNDSDARRLASSPSVRRIVLRGTAVTAAGESELTGSMPDRKVYRN